MAESDPSRGRASRRPFWKIVTDLDLSAAGDVTPDEALTRFRYVIRNLPGVTFINPDPTMGVPACTNGYRMSGVCP
jgi:hypothetical protein